MKDRWTMRDVVRVLGVPRHRIIYFCEEGVVQPLADASGRGKVRTFSTRNLFEFALALTLMEGSVPSKHIAAIIRLLGKFEKAVQGEMPFRIPEDIAALGAPEFRVVLGDGHQLSAVLVGKDGRPKVTSSVDLRRKRKGSAGDTFLRAYAPSGMALGSKGQWGEFGHPEGSRFIRTEINVTRLARDLIGRL